jgi:type II secretory pathway pseudopilin PulG
MMGFHKIPRKHTSQGFSLVEALIALTITLTILALVMSFVFQSWRNQSLVSTQNTLKQHAESALFGMSGRLAEAKILFEEDTEGAAYRNKIVFSGAMPRPVTNTFLPTIRGNGSIFQNRTCAEDSSQFFWAPSVGNSLFFVKLSGIFDTATSGITLSTPFLEQVIDLYQFNYYYITDSYNNGGIPNVTLSRNIKTPRPALQLMEWTSKLYADYEQLKAFFDNPAVNNADKTAVNAKLNALGVVGVWRKGQANPNSAFYNRNNTLSSKGSGYTLENNSLLKMLRWSNNDSGNVYSIAYNKNLTTSSSTYFKIDNAVPQFFNTNPANDCASVTPAPLPAKNVRPSVDYPLGFEVAIVGPNSGRTVYMHLTLVGQTNHPLLVEHVHGLSAYARDL